MEELLTKILADPDSVEIIIKSCINKYKPIAYNVLKEILEVYKDYSNNKELFEVQAKIKRNIFDAYVKAGFTEDQAIAFIINDNLKLMETVKDTSKKIAQKKN